MKEKQAVIATNRLMFRPGETRTYLERWDGDPQTYAVAMCESPSFPGDSHKECCPLVVVCAQVCQFVENERQYPLWAWVQLDYDVKRIIGVDLLSLGVPPGEWRYMQVMTPELEHLRRLKRLVLQWLDDQRWCNDCPNLTHEIAKANEAETKSFHAMVDEAQWSVGRTF